MTSPHPTPAELLDLHFGEAQGERQARTAAHVGACPRCREELAGVEWVDRSLAALPEEEPPADGLERLLDRIGHEPLPRKRGVAWLAPLAAGLAALGGGTAIIYTAGSRLAASAPVASGPILESARAASSFGLAALAFFAAGSFVTLALAPALLMEAQARARALAGR